MKKLKHVHPVKRWNKLSDTSRLFVALGALVVVVGGLIGWAQYQDWRNEQLLRNISADFAQLEKDLESELGIDVDNKSGCFTTQEKFSDGKTGCFMRIEHSNEENNLPVNLVLAMIASSGFVEQGQTRDNGYKYLYEGAVCYSGISNLGFYVECPLPVRSGNSDIINELF